MTGYSRVQRQILDLAALDKIDAVSLDDSLLSGAPVHYSDGIATNGLHVRRCRSCYLHDTTHQSRPRIDVLVPYQSVNDHRVKNVAAE